MHVCQYGTGETCAVALTRVRGMSKMPPARRGNEPPTPLSRQVLAGVYGHQVSFLYFLFGRGADIELYLGVRADGATAGGAERDAVAAFNSLKTCLSGTYPDVRLQDITEPSDYEKLAGQLAEMHASASVLGNPCANISGDPQRNNADRLIEALSGSHYGYVVEARPITLEDVAATFHRLAETIAETHNHVKWTSSGSTTSVAQESREIIDRFAQQYELLLETACEKTDMGLREGMWQASVTVLAENASELERVGSLVRALYAGKNSKPEPIKTVMHRNPSSCVETLRSFNGPETKTAGIAQNASLHGIDADRVVQFRSRPVR